MRQKYLVGDAAGTADEQAFKLRASAIISKYGGGAAERALYRRFPNVTAGFDYGPPRLPRRPFEETKWAALEAELETVGFWEQLLPSGVLRSGVF